MREGNLIVLKLTLISCIDMLRIGLRILMVLVIISVGHQK